MSNDKEGGCGGCKKDESGAYLANGTFMESCPETAITREFELTDGIKNGSYRELTGEEDRVSVTGSYKNGLMHGEWSFYGTDGKLSKVQIFNEGRLIEER
ncbi:MAG: hypothetical protein CVV21_11840 [Candidatus Goldiibacteriota bacterium HGW-Goldbacteria-1]|nr:MAG: hypothetical protein CVV21_11840 [Candidatus Goldiibacteriota bacterium HGW-Goldbacteria-1]